MVANYEILSLLADLALSPLFLCSYSTSNQFMQVVIKWL
jgi:hypothetical protein